VHLTPVSDELGQTLQKPANQARCPDPPRTRHVRDRYETGTRQVRDRYETGTRQVRAPGPLLPFVSAQVMAAGRKPGGRPPARRARNYYLGVVLYFPQRYNDVMKHGGTTLGCLAGSLALCTAANALSVEASVTPYQPIVERNVFGLKPPPPPPSPEEIKPPPPNIKLQGITTILGKKRALMKVMLPGKPGVKPEEQSFILTEGQRDGDIEVLEIDEVNKTVKVNNFGTVTNLDFKNNGVVIASAPAPGPPPPGAGVHNPAAGLPTPPGAQPFNPAAAGYQHPQRQIPMSRNPRVNPAAGGAAYNPGYQAAPPNVYSAVPNAPGATVSTSPGAVALSGLGQPASAPKPQQNWPPETAMTPEQAAIMEAAYTLKYKKQISEGMMPPMPDTGNPLLKAQ
jgi:hypothetical protein